MNNHNNQKDSQNRGFNNKGQQGAHAPHRPENNGNSMQNNSSSSALQSISPAKDNFAFILRKGEKLTTALYLVTDIMSEKEPMKWKAREIAVELLSDISMPSSLGANEKLNGLRDAGKKAEKIIAFLDVAQSAHLLSEMNSSVLKKEYTTLKDAIEGEWLNVCETSKSIFSESFFDVPRESIALPKQETRQIPTMTPPVPSDPVTPVAEKHAATFVKQPEAVRPMAAVAKPEQPIIAKPQTTIMTEQKHEVMNTHSPLLVIPPRQTFTSPLPPRPVTVGSDVFARGRSDADHDDRRKIILALIKQKPALTVKDIVRSIPTVSEKTIQRELLAMVSEGVLVKHGERRWSTYSLRAS